MGNYEIRVYDSEFESQFLALQRKFWGDNETRNAKYFEWKYHCNPYIKEPVIILSLCENMVVGALGVYGAKWEFAKHQVICPCAADAIVHPSHRRRGLFQGMMNALYAELAARGYSHIFGLSAGTMSYQGFLSFKWKSIGSVETVHRHRAHYFKKSLRKVRTALNRRYQVDPFAALDRASGHTNVHIERVPRPEQMNQLVRTLKYTGKIRHIRDAEYFAWRFQNPFSQYCFLYSDDAELEGYLVLQSAASVSRSAATIVDFEARTDSIRENLLRTAVEYGDFDDLFAWSAEWAGNSKLLLQRSGFQPVRSNNGNRDAPVLVRPLLNPDDDALWALGDYRITDESNWDLRWLYSDHCR